MSSSSDIASLKIHVNSIHLKHSLLRTLLKQQQTELPLTTRWRDELQQVVVTGSQGIQRPLVAAGTITRVV